MLREDGEVQVHYLRGFRVKEEFAMGKMDKTRSITWTDVFAT